MKKTLLGFAALVMAVTMLAACAATKVTAVWKDESYQGRPRKVLVYAVVKNGTNRRIIEDEFVNRLKSRGIDAIPGYDVFPGDDLVKEEVLGEKIKDLGIDTLLLTRLTGSKEIQVQVPGTVTYQPMSPAMYQPSPYYRTWQGYYNTGYTAVYTPGYTTTEETYVMAEANLYDVATGKLIWTASTQTKVGERTQKIIKNYVAVIMGAMRKQKVVP
jgi:hypothetical protein